MKIIIKDSLDPKERKKLLKILPIIYCLRKFKGNKRKVAEFLGISSRGLRLILNRYEELHPYKGNMNDELAEGKKLFFHMVKQFNNEKDFIENIKQTKAYRYLSEKEKKPFLQKIIEKYRLHN